MRNGGIAQSKNTFLAWTSSLATQRVHKTAHTADVQLKCWLIGTALYQLVGLLPLFVPGLCCGLIWVHGWNFLFVCYFSVASGETKNFAYWDKGTEGSHILPFTYLPYLPARQVTVLERLIESRWWGRMRPAVFHQWRNGQYVEQWLAGTSLGISWLEPSMPFPAITHIIWFACISGLHKKFCSIIKTHHHLSQIFFFLRQGFFM